MAISTESGFWEPNSNSDLAFGIHFHTDTLEKDMNPSLSLPAID